MSTTDDPRARLRGRYRMRELIDRIRADARTYGGTLPREAAVAWQGYLAGLIEWGVVTVTEHAVLCSLLPDADDSPVRHILLGREEADHPASDLPDDIQRTWIRDA